MGKQPRKSAEKAAPVPDAEPPRPFVLSHLDEPIPAPEILIDGVHGISVVAGNAKLRCFSARPTPENPNSATLVLRLAMPAPTLQALHVMLGQVVSKMVNDGILPKED